MKWLKIWLVLLILFMLNITSSRGLLAATDAINNDKLHMYFFNIPDGEATLIQTADKKNILINTGAGSSQQELMNQLNELNIHAIDEIILTKHEAAYEGNLTNLVNRFQVKQVITSKITPKLSQLEPQVIITTWSTNQYREITSHLSARVIDTSENGEMTLEILYGNNRVLYMGFSEQSALNEMITETTIKADIIKIPDFAQGNSPSEKLLKEIDPHIGIIFNARSGHQNPTLIERLNESWIDIYQLEQVGTTIIELSLHDYEIIS